MDDPTKGLLSMMRADLLALAFLGALIALSFWPAQDRKKAVANVVAGTAISATTAPSVYFGIMHFFPEFPVETPILGALYFWMGLLGMKLVPIVLSLVEKFAKKSEANQ